MSDTYETGTRQIDQPLIELIRGMTDRVLEEAGVIFDSKVYDPVVTYRITNPARWYGMKIYSIPEGDDGFSTAPLADGNRDVSKRWSLHVDRGTHHGAAFDNMGIVYEHGLYQPRYTWNNVNVGSIEEFVADFSTDNPDGTVDYQIKARRIPEHSGSVALRSVSSAIQA